MDSSQPSKLNLKVLEMTNDQPKRLIARLDVKSENLIKGVHLEGLRVIGDPQDFAMQYYDEGADEIIYLDIVASLYGRSNLLEIVRKTAQNIFIPLTVGGGVRNLDDVSHLLKAGADKVAAPAIPAATPTPALVIKSLRFIKNSHLNNLVHIYV